MKNLEILIELVGELRTENATLKEIAEREKSSASFWYDKFTELDKSLTVNSEN